MSLFRFDVTPTTINRLKLLGIGAIAVAPVLGSYLLYWFWAPSEHTNYGTLLDPRPVPSVTAQTADGEAFSFAQLRGRWAFVVFDAAACDAACEKKLWVVRQVRQAQGKDVGRIERVFFYEGGTLQPSLQRDYAGTWFVSAGPIGDATFPAEHSRRDHIYLVDPRGNVMLRFPADPDAKRMIRDVSRLLRYSRTG